MNFTATPPTCQRCSEEGTKDAHKCTECITGYNFYDDKCVQLTEVPKNYYLYNMTYGYIRVSTDKQTVKNQSFEIEEFAARNKISIDSWIEETASGTITPEHRELGKLIEKISNGDLIICSELSRLGRSLFMRLF